MAGRKSGSTKTGGRRKGTPNKVNAQLKEMILQALDEADPEGGIAYLKKQATDNPASFLTLIGKVLPMTIQGDASAPVTIQIVQCLGD